MGQKKAEAKRNVTDLLGMASSSLRPPPPRFPTVRIDVPGRKAPIVAAEYRPSASASASASLSPPPRASAVAAVLVLAPGSGGGLGPGLTLHPQPFANIKRRSAHGGLYMRLGMELAAGQEVGWDYRSVDPPKAVAGWAPVATLQLDYGRCPKGRLRKLGILASAVEDMVAATTYMRGRYPGAKVILGGFSFGGPVCWATARRLPRGAVDGILNLAGSARGGPRFEEAELDTLGGVRWVHDEGSGCGDGDGDGDGKQEAKGGGSGPARSLFVHGTHDSNVALQVAEYGHRAAVAATASRQEGGGGDGEGRSNSSGPGTSSLLVVRNGSHMLDTSRDAVYPLIRKWVLAVATATSVPWHGVREVEGLTYRRIAQMEAGGGGRRRPDGRRSSRSRNGAVPSSSEGREEKETAGEESWRQQPSHRRLLKYCQHSDVAHELAGLVGYSE